MSSRLARSAGLISIATLTSRLLGVVRESVLALYFGASASMQMDAYNVAFRIPNLLRDLFAEGAMTAAFVPAFTRTLTDQGRERAWHLGNQVINALLLITSAIAVLGIIFADPITALIAPKYAEVPGKLELTGNLTRLMIPFLTTVAVAVAMMGMLNSLHHFFVPSLSPAMFNVATIICVVALVPVMTMMGVPTITAVAIGTLLGGVGQVAVQWPLLRREGFRYRPTLDFRDEDLRRILRLMVPGTFGVAAVNINVLVNTYLASGLGQGPVSWLGYAFRLMYLPIGLFGVSIATAALPEVSRHAAADDLASIRKTVSNALSMMLMLNVPSTVGLVVLADPIVALLYQRGAFTTYDTAATAAALMFYAPGLLGYSAVKIASPTFYSLHDSRTPVIVSMLSIAINLVLNITFVHVLSIGHTGLALGTALSALFNAVMLMWLLGRRIGGLHARHLTIAAIKITLASAAMGVAAMFSSRWLADTFGAEAEWAKAVRVFGAIAISIGVLGLAARVLGIHEFNEATRRILRRIMPRRAAGR
jgi:putative peptidoglycan lipid II flippase